MSGGVSTPRTVGLIACLLSFRDCFGFFVGGFGASVAVSAAMELVLLDLEEAFLGRGRLSGVLGALGALVSGVLGALGALDMVSCVLNKEILNLLAGSLCEISSGRFCVFRFCFFFVSDRCQKPAQRGQGFRLDPGVSHSEIVTPPRHRDYY